MEDTVCQAFDCTNRPTVASAANPITRQIYRVCTKHAKLFDELDDASRVGYAHFADLRAFRPRLVTWDE